MQAVFVDINNDRYPEIFIGNDVSTSVALFLNQGNEGFENQAGLAGVLDYRAGMGIAIADFWNRGWLGFLVTHWVAEDHVLWRNVSDASGRQGRLVFEDVAPQIGLTPKPSAEVGWWGGLTRLSLFGG